MAFDGSLESSALALQCGKKSSLRSLYFDSLSVHYTLSPVNLYKITGDIHTAFLFLIKLQ